MEIKDEIAAWVRTARKHAELSGEALGRELALELRTTRGNTKGNISHWEQGKHQPSIAQLLAISKITAYPLPVSIRELHGGQADDFKTRAQRVKSAATAGYEYFFNHVATALTEREVPPHIQSAIITLLDTCPPKAKPL
jgi:transcriptional regulator with XRE-family HTH domain